MYWVSHNLTSVSAKLFFLALNGNPGVPVQDEPLHREGSISSLALLLLDRKAKADAPDEFGCTPLHLAIERGVLSFATAVLRVSRINVDQQDKQGNTALHYAGMSGLVKCGSAEAVRLLLKHNADPRVRNHAGQTAVDIISEVQTSRHWTETEALALKLGCGYLTRVTQKYEQAQNARAELLKEENR